MKINTSWLAFALIICTVTFCHVYVAEGMGFILQEHPPCWKTVKTNMARFGGNPPQDFVNPSCDKDGYFTALQCRPMMGCFCVDKYGNPTTQPSRGRSFTRNDCNNLSQGTNPVPTTQFQPAKKEHPPCWKTVRANKARFGGNPPQDFVNPSCDKDGYFAPLQCSPMMGCFCVDKYGHPTTELSRGRSFVGCTRNLIQGTKPAPTSKVQPTTKEHPPCWKTVRANKARFGGNPPQDFVNPSCDKDGYFTALQCRPMMGCFCVDKYGNPTTQPSRGRSFIPDCRKLAIKEEPMKKFSNLGLNDKL